LSVSLHDKQSEAVRPLAVKHDGCLLASVIATHNLVVASNKKLSKQLSHIAAPAVRQSLQFGEHEIVHPAVASATGVAVAPSTVAKEDYPSPHGVATEVLPV
jgi:hypothetical protein